MSHRTNKFDRAVPVAGFRWVRVRPGRHPGQASQDREEINSPKPGWYLVSEAGDQQLYDPSFSPTVASSELALASSLLALGQRDEARQWLRKADEILARHARLGPQYTQPQKALKARLL